MKRLVVFYATFFGVGRIRIAPGTWTSLIVSLIAFLAARSAPPSAWLPLATAVVFFTGIPAAAACEAHFQKKDPRQCVVDEVAGQMVALWFLPHSIGFYAAAFLLFRFFDIYKPFPIKASEHIPYGIGIMLDDVLAGFYALGTLRAIQAIFIK